MKPRVVKSAEGVDEIRAEQSRSAKTRIGRVDGLGQIRMGQWEREPGQDGIQGEEREERCGWAVEGAGARGCSRCRCKVQAQVLYVHTSWGSRLGQVRSGSGALGCYLRPHHQPANQQPPCATRPLARPDSSASMPQGAKHGS